MTVFPAASCETDVSKILDLGHAGVDRYFARATFANYAGIVFGGVLVAQSLQAASLTVDHHLVHSLQAQFLRPTRTDLPLEFVVRRSSDGRRFSRRTVSARQDGREVFTLAASFHGGGIGPEHAQTWKSPPPDPDDLPSMQVAPAALADLMDARAMALFCRPHPIEIRFVDGEDYMLRRARPSGRFWLRLPSTPLEWPPARQFIAASLGADEMLGAVVTLGDRVCVYDAGISSVSLDFAMWFHAPVKACEWMLHETESPWAKGGRGIAAGRMFDRAGNLFATTMMEMCL